MILRFERGALADLEEILAYIARENPDAAARLAIRIEDIARKLAENPYLGEATERTRFRRFPIGNYLMVYEVTDAEVIVHYIRHGARRRPWEGQ